MRRVLVALSFVGVMAVPAISLAQSPEPSLVAVPLHLCMTVTVPPDLLLLPESLSVSIADGTSVITEVAECPVVAPVASPLPSPIVTPAPTTEPTAKPKPTARPLASLPFASLKNKAKKVGYKSLLRNPDSYEGKPIYLKGQVLQAQDDGAGGQFALVSVTKSRFGFWDNNVAINYAGKPRIIAEDIVEFVMTGEGVYGYESAGSGYLTVPTGTVIKLRMSH